MTLLDYIFPKMCVVCSKVGKDICDNCIKKLTHTLPCCAICNKVNKGYISHDSCFNIKISFYTGWYLDKNIEYILSSKNLQSSFSFYTYLFDILVNYINIEQIVQNSYALPIYSEDIKENMINKHLVNHIKSNNKNKGNTLFIGYTYNQNNTIVNNIKRLPTRESSSVKFLTLFKPIQLQE